ncbi:small ribosomal subunit Rsm22 family protein [Mesorhizobium sp. LHD-90]|uniref:small ribosomal subunit Rsm22 family protein n=1 Tax=Mesorhizobium sp. LHD-90 TaxID=3071414 RepID=UPI0027DFD604|nr:small ribosomal subunit Rsm22 family protein [Mesorhizobium sp. LHD-90]MDQ6435106.1 small ribosomal subunit Rsm22 family protein [Mesorhizobium sp. LHD-90]
MELPRALRQGVDRLLEKTPLADLQRASSLLSSRYRAELRDGRLHLDGELAVKSYLAARLPATYAAIRASLEAAAELVPDFAPKTLLDLGAGPGSALWAAHDRWPEIGDAVLVEASAAARSVGGTLCAELPAVAARWVAGDVTSGLPDLKPADLVTLSYVLDELDPAQRGPLVDRLWALTAGILVIVEPGTPAGWQRILAARGRLIAAGAHLVAPCPHERPCPLAPPDWCHFSRRVARSRLHRLAKGGDVPWEDEKYIFVAAARQPVQPPQARVIAPPRGGKGVVTLKLCKADGGAAERTLSKRDGENFRIARRLDWSDAVQQDFDSGS